MGRCAELFLAILIVAVVVATVALPALRLLLPPWLWLAKRRGFLTLYAVAPSRDGDLQLLGNASFSVWAFYPTPRGTVFQGVYNGTGGLVYINLSSLVSWAEAWVSYYGPQAVYYFMPSLVVFISYPVVMNSTAVEVISQQFMVPLNLTAPLTGRGEVIKLSVTRPLRFYYARPEASGLKHGVTLGHEVLTVTGPEQTTTTTTTSTPVSTTYTYQPPYCYEYVPHVLAWYPSNSSLAPISLAIAPAQPASESSMLSIPIAFGSAVINEVGFNAVAAAGAAFSDAVNNAAAGAIGQALSALSPIIPGATLTFTQAKVSSAGDAIASTLRLAGPDVSQLFIVGQVALVNWTIYIYCINTPRGPWLVSWYKGWQVGTMLTALKVIKSGNAVAPAIYLWQAYDPCVNVSAWAHEYPKVEFGYGNPGLPQEVYDEIVNASCPMPNTPAPVDWQDYAYNMTKVAVLQPGGVFNRSYVNLEATTGPSTLGAALDAGSALASAGAAALIAAGVAAPEASLALVVAALMSSVQFTTVAAAESANYIFAYSYQETNVTFVYLSNMTPKYSMESNGLSVTLPRELILINTSAP